MSPSQHDGRQEPQRPAECTQSWLSHISFLTIYDAMKDYISLN